MDAALEKIAALAWRTVPAAEANEAIGRARRATAAAEAAARRGLAAEETAADLEDDFDGPEARSYEIVLGEGATFESFVQNHLPKLVYHLESVGAHLPNAGGVVVCLFLGDRLHFLLAGEFIGAVAREMKTTPEALAEQFGTHELRTAIRRDDS